MTTLALRAYVDQFNLSAIPLRTDGTPPPNWKDYARHRASERDFLHWQKLYPDSRVAIVLGRVSGVIALVVDGWKFGEEFKHLLSRHNNHRHVFYFTPTIESPTGYTILFKHPGHEVHKLMYKGGALTLLGEFQYVVAPPSKFPDTIAYQWMQGRSIENTLPQPLPYWIADFFPGY